MTKSPSNSPSATPSRRHVARRQQSSSPDTSGALTPPSSDGSPHSPGRRSGSSHRGSPVLLLENGMENLAIDREDEIALPASAPRSPSPRIDAHMAALQLRSPTSSASSRSTSLLPGAHSGSPRHTGTRRRSSSRHRVLHEIDDETLPESTFCRPEFQNALAQSREVARQLAVALAGGRLHLDENSAIRGFYRKAEAASNYTCPETWRIGFVGDSGAGKSSLINSLLDTRDLARTSNGGSACTCTVTEYHYRAPDPHEPPYAIEVVFITEQDLLHSFEDLLAAYREYHQPPGDGRPPTDDNRAARDNLEEMSDVAWRTFEAAFGAQPELTEAYLTQEAKATIMAQFKTWIERFTPYRLGQAGESPYIRQETLQNEEECRNRLSNLTSELGVRGAAASWPYIGAVRVFLPASVLRKGLILVDLPGLHDINSARRKITQRYIVDCNEVFAIANIGRAQTDMGVQAVIRLAQETQRGYVGIVCTRSDDIIAEEAERDFTGVRRDELRRRMTNLANSEAYLQAAADDLDDARQDEDRHRAFDLSTVVDTATEDVRVQEQELQRFMITARNGDVTADLNLQNQATVQRVFCVSNTMYWNHRGEDRGIAVPWLELSGIISLRRYCLGLVAERQREPATKFIESEIPTLISEINLWVQSGSAQIAIETRRQVREASLEVERILQGELADSLSESNQVKSALEREFNILLQSHNTARKVRHWREGAQSAEYEWSGWHHTSYAAFCRNYGEHTTATVGRRCWNEEIIRNMTEDLAKPWQRFRRHVASYFRQRHLIIGTAFEQALHPLRNLELPVIHRDNFDSVQTLIETLLLREQLLRNEAHNIVAGYQKAIAQVGNVDFLSSIRTSFVGQHMESAYRNAARDFGTGVDVRRKALIRQKVTNRELFGSLFEQLEASFITHTTNAEREIRRASKRHFRSVREALDLLRNEHVVQEAERNPEFRESMRVQVVDAQQRSRDIIASIAAM